MESININLPDSGIMPLLFLGHGSPMNAIEENEFTEAFRQIAGILPKPKAILCISAHWFIKGSKVTAMEMPKTIHDFYGFPKELFAVQYPAKGNPILAGEIKELLMPNQIEMDKDWGLDHGTWSVLCKMYPNAEIPVIQLSIDYSKPFDFHFELAKKLGSLREKGILIIGSGNIVHNLSQVDFRNFDKVDYGYGWAIEARETINGYLLNRNYKALVNPDKQNKALQLAIPTPDHYLPLIYILGLHRENEELQLFNNKMVAGSLSMTSLIIS
jgi:4,5-DOPA dioxygenase extradiol